MGLTTGQRRFLLLAVAGLAATGLAWAWSDLVHGLGPIDDEAAQAARAWLGRIHGAFAMLGLVAFGAVAAGHVPLHWKAGARRPSGIALAAILALLVVTGYTLYYAADDFARAASAWGHIAAGVAATAVFALHWLRRASAGARDC